MSNIDLIIEERPTSIGNFMVGRLLPFRQKRMVGPFIFIDHMGPKTLDEHEHFDVPPHPHIGLSTLTYLFEGRIMHRDSIGSAIEIKPGQVNWMTAGAGIVHSERTPDDLRDKKKSLHGLQIWVALPKALEQSAPSFYHADENDLPGWEEEGLNYKLIAGSALGYRSPVPVYSDLHLLEIKSGKNGGMVRLGKDLDGESAMYILEGKVESDGHEYGAKQILVPHAESLCEFKMHPGTTVYLFGGEKFEEDRLIYWNFVASDQSLIDEAKRKWKAQEFDKIEGETEFVPLPEK